jgi:hypothetical protein
MVWFDVGAAVTVAFPESELPLPLVAADDPDAEAVLDPVVLVPDRELVLVAVPVVLPVADVVLSAEFELLSCLLFNITWLLPDESGHGQACVKAAKDATVARSCTGRMLEVIE